MYFDPKLGHIVEAIVKNEKGEVTAYKLENGEIVMKEQAIMMAKQGTIRGVSIEGSKDGQEFLKSLPDNDKNNFLENLPSIDESTLR
jgi:hypothetical protein